MATKAQTRSTDIAVLLLLTVIAATAGAQDLRLQHPSLQHTEFHVFLKQPVESQQASEAFCRQKHLATASTREVRYFWKQLPYNISFYLGSKIEMTTDHPEIERGEVICFPLKRINRVGAAGAAAAGSAVDVASNGGSGGSCRGSVTSVLCKRQSVQSNCTEQRLPLQNSGPEADRQGKGEEQRKQLDQTSGTASFKAGADGWVCMNAPLFWTLAAGTGGLVLVLAVTSATLAACSLRLKRQLSRGGSFGYRCLPRQLLQSGRQLGNKPLTSLGGSHQASGAALDTDDGAGFFL